jgi:hypothetical protein
MDDCRLSLASDNVFRYYSQGDLPDISADIVEHVNLLTASEIEAIRLAGRGL